MGTSMGTVKKTALNEFNNPRKSGIIAANLDDSDYLIGAALTDGRHDVMLFSDGGKAVRFDENDVRPLGRQTRGVRGMMLEEGQSLIAMLVSKQHATEVTVRKTKDAVDALQTQIRGVEPDSEEEQNLQAELKNARDLLHSSEEEMQAALANLPQEELPSVLTATENGYGKRTSIVEYTRHGRGTKGMIAIQQTERNGKVVAATLVRADDEIMLITDRGVLVRTRVSEIRELGRATQGVTLIGLDEGSKLSGLQRIVENDANVSEPDESDDLEEHTPADDDPEDSGSASTPPATPEA